jgi:uncharacterized SAM-binding protein YcdF (DUF218 family)
MFHQEELLTRIFCDTLPSVTADGAYLFGQTEDNQESVFLSAQELVAHAFVRRILISDAQPKSGYPGGQAWRRALMGLGISSRIIEEVPVEPTPTLNTLIEAESLMQHAKNKNYSSIIVVATPFHQERAFMTAVSVAIRDYSELCLYSYPGRALSWDEQVAHSQGTVVATRAELIWGEQGRIRKYQKKGDLAAYSQVLAYLRKRDKAR